MRQAIAAIDEKLVAQWVEDLVIAKTFAGLRFQESILKKISAIKGVGYRRSTPAEESKGIDGFIGELPVSIKPKTYMSKEMLSEKILVKIVYYTKLKDGIQLEFD